MGGGVRHSSRCLNARSLEGGSTISHAGDRPGSRCDLAPGCAGATIGASSTASVVSSVRSAPSPVASCTRRAETRPIQGYPVTRTHKSNSTQGVKPQTVMPPHDGMRCGH
jgi:hypothetical protein